MEVRSVAHGFGRPTREKKVNYYREKKKENPSGIKNARRSGFALYPFYVSATVVFFLPPLISCSFHNLTKNFFYTPFATLARPSNGLSQPPVSPVQQQQSQHQHGIHISCHPCTNIYLPICNARTPGPCFTRPAKSVHPPRGRWEMDRGSVHNTEPESRMSVQVSLSSNWTPIPPHTHTHYLPPVYSFPGFFFQSLFLILLYPFNRVQFQRGKLNEQKKLPYFQMRRLSLRKRGEIRHEVGSCQMGRTTETISNAFHLTGERERQKNRLLNG